ncbi:MAG: DMT family transporter [Paracoccaceae bacterium]
MAEAAPVPLPAPRVGVGVAWMVLTTVLFVCVTGIVRHVGATIPAVEAAFIRYAAGVVLMAPLMLRLLKRPPTRGAMKLHVSRGVVHGLGVMLWFYAMARIPIAEVTALGYVAPIFVTIGAAIFLGERLQLRRIGAVAAGILGALVILRPGFEEVSIGQLAQLGAAPCFAASFLMAKGLTREEDPAVIVGLLSVFVTLVLAPMAILQWSDPTWEEVGWLCLTAVFATGGHWSMTKAFQCAPITVTQPVQFLQLVWATILGIVAFGEPIDPYVILGGGIVVAAATYIAHRERSAARKALTPPAPALKS